MKRLFDFIFSLCGLLVLSPFLVIISIAVLFSMGWPVFYSQIRVGKGGVTFKIFKFRSMIKDAENIGPAFTVGGDPRITGLGRFLRRTKLDELPQLFNVLFGQMSFVGPRPEVPQYVERYSDEQRRVLTVKPGMTDPASIVYRNEEEVLARYDDRQKAYVEKLMPAKLKLNLEYIDKSNFFSDISLIFKTINKLFSGR